MARPRIPIHDEPEAPKEIIKRSGSGVNAQIAEALRPMIEKVGGSIGTAEELEHLHQPLGYTKTGIYPLDNLLSAGRGVPHGRFVEVFAPESVGKSALCEFMMGAFKRDGGDLAHIDSEKTRDDAHLACYGIKPADYLDPDLPDLESVWDFARGTLRVLKKQEKPSPYLIVLDSLAATPSRAELEEKEHDDSHVGLQARSNAKGVRVTVRGFSASTATFLFINQIRDKIGAMGYGPKTDTPGGRALKFAYSIRLKLAKIETLKKGSGEGAPAIGHIIEVQSVKNKLAPPQMKCHLMLSYSRGIDVGWSNFYWFQKNGYVVAKGRTGFTWKGLESEPFKRSEFAEWSKANKKAISAAVAELAEADLKAVRSAAEVATD